MCRSVLAMAAAFALVACVGTPSAWRGPEPFDPGAIEAGGGEPVRASEPVENPREKAEKEIAKFIAENPSAVSKVARKLAGKATGRVFGNMFNFEDGPAESLFQNLQLELKTFENQGAESSLGFGYDYEKSHEFGEQRDENGIPANHAAFELRAKGSVAFDDATNPADFLVSEVAFSYWLGNVPGWTGTEAQFTGLINEMVGAAGNEAKLRRIRARMAELVDPNHYFVEAELHGGYETNQRFTARNVTVGGSLWLDVKSYGQDTLLSWLNVADYPFAITRWLSGWDGGFSPRGNALPYLRAKLDLVEPEGNDPRAMVGDNSAFPRLMLEAGMKTPFLRLKWGGEERDLFVGVNYRYFQELDASAAVQAAGLESYDYVAVAITHQDGFFATYRAGRLPFDVSDDNAFEVGWNFAF